MKKISILLMAVAIIAGIGGAVAATTPTAKAPTVYYLSSDGNYYPAGIKDYDYECQWDHWGTCTYTYNATTGQYVPYEAGKIVWIR